MRLVAWGEKMIPARREMTEDDSLVSMLNFKPLINWELHTRLRQVEFLFEKIRD